MGRRLLCRLLGLLRWHTCEFRHKVIARLRYLVVLLLRWLGLLSCRLMILHGRLDSHGNHLLFSHAIWLARTSVAASGKNIRHLHLAHVVETHHGLQPGGWLFLLSSATASICILLLLDRVLRLLLRLTRLALLQFLLKLDFFLHGHLCLFSE